MLLTTFTHTYEAGCVHNYRAEDNARTKAMPQLPPSGHGWGFDHLVVNDPACGAKSTIKLMSGPG